MANAGCINAYNCDGCLIQTLGILDSANIGVGVQFCAPDPLDDKRLDYIKYTDKCGNTCCLSGENEILIYATNGVIKNFTLTNDDTNEVVNVKRTDIFGSNRKKTVVRYKTGGYPTSITDGTLAVEELVMNQYASSGFNVEGLEDGTTYYFSAFAVAQDDTIIVVQTNSITPEFGRRPDSNTIAYWKLNSQTTTSDATGNHNLTLNGSVSYASDYVNLPGSSAGYFTTSPFISAGGSFTISLFCNFDNVSTQRQPIIQQFNDSTNNSAIAIWGSQNKRFIWGRGQGDWTLNSPTITAGQRYNATLVYTPGTLKFYINATLVGTYSRTINTTSPNFFGIGKGRETSSPAYFKGKVGNIVVENTAQGETRISNFFNKLKSKYGF